jgi:heme oxygenase
MVMLSDAPPDNAALAGGVSLPGLRGKLKAATEAAHYALDARFASYDLTSLNGYRRFLEANAAALLPLETALENSGVADVFADWPERSRRAAMEADLEAMDGSVKPLPDVALMSRAEMLGTMYVLEGSRLGAKYMMRHFASCQEPRIVSATNYLRHGDGLPLWRTFLDVLEREPMTTQGEAETLSGAERAFAMFAKAAGV